MTYPDPRRSHEMRPSTPPTSSGARGTIRIVIAVFAVIVIGALLVAVYGGLLA